MKKNSLSRLEILPNEILLLIFLYIDARDLFRAFLHLNSRFNRFIQSFEQLHLVYHMKDSHSSKEIFSYYVHTLTIDPLIKVNLQQFRNIRRLKLRALSETILRQLNSITLPFLKHLVLYDENILKSIDPLNALTLGCGNSLRFTTILSSCSHLHSLDIGLTAIYRRLDNSIMHSNLRQMILRIRSIIHSSMDTIMINYLSCTPNLEQLTIHLFLAEENAMIESFVDYDWFQLSINRCLPVLQNFRCYLYLRRVDVEQMKIFSNRLMENFHRAHRRYHARLSLRSVD